MATENSPRLSARDQLLTVTSAARGLVKTADNSVRNKLLLDDRRAALTLGRFNHSSYPVDMWQSPKLKLVVFFSSTFTDTYHERNTLMMEILKELRDIALPHGIPVTFVDMRWGVRDENTKDHLTWFECARELARCREESV